MYRNDEDRRILPGVEAVAAPGHTPGLMTVAIETAKGRAVIDSESGHLFRLPSHKLIWSGARFT